MTKKLISEKCCFNNDDKDIEYLDNSDIFDKLKIRTGRPHFINPLEYKLILLSFI